VADERRKTERRKGGTPGGMRPSAEDIQWLRLLDMGGTAEIPPFNKSRLFALGLVSRVGTEVQITEKGTALLRG